MKCDSNDYLLTILFLLKLLVTGLLNDKDKIPTKAINYNLIGEKLLLTYFITIQIVKVQHNIDFIKNIHYLLNNIFLLYYIISVYAMMNTIIISRIM
jgi:hypothetical protein